MEQKEIGKEKKVMSTCHLIDQCTLNAPYKLICPIRCY